MHRSNMLTLLAVAVLAFPAWACWPDDDGSEGEFGEGNFIISCADQLPSLCDETPLPPLAVGTSVEINYEHERRGYIADVEPVSGKLFGEPGWSAFYCGDSETIYDYTRIRSESIDEIKLIGPAGELDEPIELGCGEAPPDETFIVPIGTSRDRLMGVGDWTASVVPDVADVGIDGNGISFAPDNDTDSDVSAVLTIAMRDGSVSADFDLLVCSEPEVPDEPAETVIEEADAVEVPDVVEEDVTEEDVVEDAVEEDITEDVVEDEIEDAADSTEEG